MESAVYGGTNNYGKPDGQNYTSFSDNAPRFGTTPRSPPAPPSLPASHYGTSSFKPPESSGRFCPTTNVTAKPYSPSAATFPTSPKFEPAPIFASSPKFPDSSSYDHYSTAATKAFESLDNDYIAKNLSSDFQTSTNLGGSDGYRTSEYTTNTSKIPGGYKTDSYKYESYHSSSQPVITSATEKYYTSTPEKFGHFSPTAKDFGGFNNGTGTDYHSTYSSNVEVVNEPPVIKDTDSLEQKMLKKSVTQQIVEKKTVATTKTTKQESSTKSFRFE